MMKSPTTTTTSTTSLLQLLLLVTVVTLSTLTASVDAFATAPLSTTAATTSARTTPRQLSMPTPTLSQISVSSQQPPPKSFPLPMAKKEDAMEEASKEDDDDTKKTNNMMSQIKEAGAAGAISLFIWELAFWAISIPVAIFGFVTVSGAWPDFSNQDDIAKVGAEAFAFANVARLALPVRIGLAVATTPWVKANIVEAEWAASIFNKEEDDKVE